MLEQKENENGQLSMVSKNIDVASPRCTEQHPFLLRVLRERAPELGWQSRVRSPGTEAGRCERSSGAS